MPQFPHLEDCCFLDKAELEHPMYHVHPSERVSQQQENTEQSAQGRLFPHPATKKKADYFQVSAS